MISPGKGCDGVAVRRHETVSLDGAIHNARAIARIRANRHFRSRSSSKFLGRRFIQAAPLSGSSLICVLGRKWGAL
jgi:hypothetical protein